MKSNGVAEMRRNYEELVNALRLLEDENRRLRVEVARLKMTGAGAGPAGVKNTSAGQHGPASSGASAGRESDAPAPGQFVDYLPPGGKKGTVPRLALVLEVKPGGVLRLKVKHAAQQDEVLDDVGPTRWRMRA